MPLVVYLAAMGVPWCRVLRIVVHETEFIVTAMALLLRPAVRTVALMPALVA